MAARSRLAIHGAFNNGIEVNGSGAPSPVTSSVSRQTGCPAVVASGVYVNNTSNNTIGGTTPADRNVISNNRDGVFIAAGADDSMNNNITGNYIGTNPVTAAQGNINGIFVGGFEADRKWKHDH